MIRVNVPISLAFAACLMAGCGTSPAAELGRDLAFDVAGKVATNDCNNYVGELRRTCDDKADAARMLVESLAISLAPADEGLDTDKFDAELQEHLGKR